MIRMKKILIIAAHPDDDILGCGGTISRISTMNNSDVKFRVVFIAEGTTCRFSVSEHLSEQVQKEIQHRNDCARKALEYLGITDIVYHNLPCGRLDTVPLIDIGKIIENEIITFKPDTIFTHSNIDVNNDHLKVFQATLQATRPNALNFVPRVYLYEVLSTSEWRFLDAFKPTIFFSLNEVYIQAKIQALKLFDSEIKDFPFPRSDEGIRTLAKYRGMQAGCDFAESFIVLREVIR